MHQSPHSKVDAISPLSSYRGVIMSKMYENVRGSFLWSILYKGELGLIHYSDCIDFSKQQLCMKLTKPRASHFLTLHHMLIIRFI